MRTPRRRSFPLVIALVAVAVLSGAAGALGARFIRSPQQVMADARPPAPAVLTAPVTRSALARHLVFQAKVGSGHLETIRVGSDGLVTDLLTRVGARVDAGAAVLAVNDRPVIVLQGVVGLYRALQVGARGRDVARLQTALNGAGVATPIDGVFGPATGQALARLYGATGFDPPLAPVTEGAAREVVAQPAELAFVPSLPASVAQISGAVGGVAAEAELALAASPPSAVASISPADAVGLKAGQQVVLVGPDGRRSAGLIDEIRAPRVTGDQVLVPLRIRPRPPGRIGTAGQDLQVRVTSGVEDVGLVVPDAAIRTRASGDTYVTVLAAGRSRSVPVEVIAEADGRVRVDAADRLRPGDDVVVGVR